MGKKIKNDMSSVDVLIIVEHVNRELDTAILLKNCLERKGLSVAIRSLYFHFWHSVKHLRPRLIVTPWCYGNPSILRYSRIPPQKNSKLILFNLHSEQVAGLEEMTNFYVPEGRAKDLYHVSWGENYSSFLRKARIKENLFVESGSPRMDFYKKKFLSLSNSRTFLSKKYGLNNSKKWLLFPSNFGYASDSGYLTLQRKIVGKYAPHMKESRKAYKKFLPWFEKLARFCTNNDWELIYRPHPSENEPYGMNKIADLFNVHVIPELPMRHWLLAVDKIVLWRSTSSAECLAAGKPVYRVDFDGLELSNTWDDIPILRSLPGINSSDENFRWLSNEDEKTIWDLSSSEFQDMFFSGESSCLFIADKINEILKSNSGEGSFKHQKIGFLKGNFYYYRELLKVWAQERDFLKYWSKYVSQNRDYFNLEESEAFSLDSLKEQE